MFTEKLNHTVFKHFLDNDIASTEINSHKVETKHNLDDKMAFMTGMLTRDPYGRAYYLHTVDRYKRENGRIEISGIASKIDNRRKKIGRYIYVFKDFEVKKYGNVTADPELTAKWVALMEERFGAEYTRAYKKHLQLQSGMEK